MQSHANNTLEGRWQMIRAEFNGQMAPDMVVDKTELWLTAAAYDIRYGGESSDRGTVEFTAAQSAAGMTLRATGGGNVGRVVACIYQLAGDRLRICFGLDGRTPTAFVADEHRYLATYRRLID